MRRDPSERALREARRSRPGIVSKHDETEAIGPLVCVRPAGMPVESADGSAVEASCV
jgi:hypothetical protein